LPLRELASTSLSPLVSSGRFGGGQNLVPAMNFRLARPLSLIDINRIDAPD